MRQHFPFPPQLDSGARGKPTVAPFRRGPETHAPAWEPDRLFSPGTRSRRGGRRPGEPVVLLPERHAPVEGAADPPTMLAVLAEMRRGHDPAVPSPSGGESEDEGGSKQSGLSLAVLQHRAMLPRPHALRASTLLRWLSKTRRCVGPTRSQPSTRNTDTRITRETFARHPSPIEGRRSGHIQPTSTGRRSTPSTAFSVQGQRRVFRRYC